MLSLPLPRFGSPVIGLLTVGRQTTVFRRVISVIVDAIYCEIIWYLSYISEKILKSEPMFANTDAATAIVLERRNIWVAASRKHVAPNSIGAGSKHAVLASRRVQFHTASACRGVSGAKTIADDDEFIAAVAMD